MAYDKTNWNTGDKITAAKLNKIEKGIEDASGGGSGGGTMYVNLHYEEVEGRAVYTMDKTVAEIAGAVEAGSNVVLKYTYEGDTNFYTLTECAYQSTAGADIAKFTGYWHVNDTIWKYEYTLYDNGNVYYEEKGIKGTIVQ